MLKYLKKYFEDAEKNGIDFIFALMRNIDSFAHD